MVDKWLELTEADVSHLLEACTKNRGLSGKNSISKS